MGFLAGNARTATGNSSSAPSRKTSEGDLNQFNLELKSNPVYQKFLAENGLVDTGSGVKLTRGQQGALQDRLFESGMNIPAGMHIDQGGNFNQKNRLARNTAIAAGVGAGGYFAAPAIAGALGGGGAAGGGAAGGAGAAGGSAIPTITGTALTTGMAGTAPTLAGATTLAGGVAAGGGGAAAAGGGSGIMNALSGGAKSKLGSAALRGGGALFGSLMARKAQNDAMKRSPEEQAALAGGQRAGNQLGASGGSMLQTGQESLAAPTQYWSRLLGGNRASMAQATAAPRAAITDTYRGAERGLERSGVRGAQRDVAKAELGRDRAGKIAGLTTGVQPFAAQQLADIGGGQSELGGRMLGQSGNIFAELLGQGSRNRQYAREEGEKSGTNWGSLIFDMISGYGKK